MQSKLRKIYDGYHILPPIIIDSYSINGMKRERESDLKSLESQCFKKLPWYTSIINESYKIESNTKQESNISRPAMLFTNFNFSKAEIEDKYRNFNAKVVKLQTEDFSLHYRHKIKTLKMFQTILTGKSDLIVNNANYLKDIEKELEVRNHRLIEKRSCLNYEKEDQRSRMEKILFPLVETKNTVDPFRKFEAEDVFTEQRMSVDFSQIESVPISSNVTLESKVVDILEMYEEAEEYLRNMNEPNKPIKIILKDDSANKQQGPDPSDSSRPISKEEMNIPFTNPEVVNQGCCSKKKK